VFGNGDSFRRGSRSSFGTRVSRSEITRVRHHCRSDNLMAVRRQQRHPTNSQRNRLLSSPLLPHAHRIDYRLHSLSNLQLYDGHAIFIKYCGRMDVDSTGGVCGFCLSGGYDYCVLVGYYGVC